MRTPPKLPMKDQPKIVQMKSLFACMYLIVPVSVREWKAILGLSLYFSSSSSNFFYLFVLCSRWGLSKLYGPSTCLTLSFLASSIIFSFIACLSTMLSSWSFAFILIIIIICNKLNKSQPYINREKMKLFSKVQKSTGYFKSSSTRFSAFHSNQKKILSLSS